MSIYLQLFLTFMQIGAFSFGGGYAILPLIKEQVVEAKGWLTLTEFGDVVTLSQMTPGPIAINAATFVGLRLGGIFGAIIASLGCILPACIIVMTIAYFYMKYRNLTVMQGVLGALRPAVVSLIATAGLSILLLALFGSDEFPIVFSNLNITGVIIFAASLFVLRKFKLGPIYVMLGAGLVGVSIHLLL